MNRQNKTGLVAVFDLDKTLIDSGRKLQTDVANALARLGVKILPEQVTGDWYGLARSYGVSKADFDRELDKRKSWEQALRDGDAPLFTDTIPCLENLQDAGVRLGALTRSNEEYTNAKLDILGLRNYFEDRVAITPFGSKRGKEPEAIELIDQLDSNSIDRAYFIGDSPEDVIVDREVHNTHGIETHGIHIVRKNGKYQAPEAITKVEHPFERYNVKSLSEVPEIILKGCGK
jgi:phosphoglycolate phosphatase-like HAD superfamily hydrolase